MTGVTHRAFIGITCVLALQCTGARAEPPQADRASATRNGREIYAQFRAGLADPSCDTASSARWRGHFATAPMRLAAAGDDVLPLFGYVVDALRAASLPTEFALIPFVESGYKPGARSPGGPAGLWQMIAVTARDHQVPIRAGYDGRLSPVDSTQAAVRYLKTLHGMFAGDWRLAVMAYNAGEYRVFGALRRSGQSARQADPEKLVSLSGISQAYVRKLHALSCLLDQADDRDTWMQALDRPAPRLEAITLPAGAATLDAWSATSGRDGAIVRRLNPAYVDGRIGTARAQRILAPMVDAMPIAAPAAAPIASIASDIPAAMVSPEEIPATVVPGPRTHIVGRGESLWTIARRYRMPVSELLSRNGLATRSILRPGAVLKLDADVDR